MTRFKGHVLIFLLAASHFVCSHAQESSLGLFSTQHALEPPTKRQHFRRLRQAPQRSPTHARRPARRPQKNELEDDSIPDGIPLVKEDEQIHNQANIDDTRIATIASAAGSSVPKDVTVTMKQPYLKPLPVPQPWQPNVVISCLRVQKTGSKSLVNMLMKGEWLVEGANSTCPNAR